MQQHTNIYGAHLLLVSVDAAHSRTATYRDVLMYQPPTCIHHLAFPRLGCLWGKVSYEGDCVCVCIVFTNVCERERQTEGKKET